MAVNKLLRDRIKEVAKKRGMTLTDLERALNLGGGTIQHWNKVCPNTNKLLLVSDYLEVSLDYLVRGYDYVPNAPASEKEYSLIEYYRQLNDAGKANLMEYATFLSVQEKYICSEATDH